MNKLSAADRREVLAEVPGTLLKLAAERDFYRGIALSGLARQRVEKVASAMIEKGLRDGSIQDVANELEKAASAGELNLDVTEQAVELVGPDMGKHAHLSDELSGATGSSDLERFVLS
jgi:hypothetical protein